MQSSLSEHFDFVVSVSAITGTALLSTLLYIFNGLRNEIKELKDTLQKISEELFNRVHVMELSLERLWAEHRTTHKSREIK